MDRGDNSGAPGSEFAEALADLRRAMAPMVEVAAELHRAMAPLIDVGMRINAAMEQLPRIAVPL